MTVDSDAPLEVMWQGRYVTAVKRGRWEYVSRTGSTGAVVVLAEHDGKVILVEQHRVPVGGPCLELPAGLVGGGGRHCRGGFDVALGHRRATGQGRKRSPCEDERFHSANSLESLVQQRFGAARRRGQARVR